MFASLVRVSEAMCSIKYLTKDKVQELSNPECFTPSSEPFRIQLFKVLYMLHCLQLACWYPNNSVLPLCEVYIASAFI
jgi:hypothetical protein